MLVESMVATAAILEIIFPAGFIGQGISIRILHWLDGAIIPLKYS
jgi:hypothetical protein